jgi:hypothetical protein
MFDITEKKTFTALGLICIVIGSFLGVVCALLFDTVSHIMVLGTKYEAVPIPVFWGVVFILIMAASSLAISLTFRYVPGWVIEYYQHRKIPTPFVKAFEFLKQIDRELQEDNNMQENKEDPETRKE